MFSFSHRLITVVILAATLAAAGCQATAADRLPAQQQLIIQFKTGAAGCDRAGIAALSRGTGLRLQLVRPMSGDGCVVALAARDAGGLEQGKNILRQQAAIESVEEDLPMKAL